MIPVAEDMIRIFLSSRRVAVNKGQKQLSSFQGIKLRTRIFLSLKAAPLPYVMYSVLGKGCF